MRNGECVHVAVVCVTNCAGVGGVTAMAIIIHLQFERDERVDVDRPATLRTNRIPSDVVVRNLSCSGCLVETPDMPPLDTHVSIGMSGIGVRTATVVRQTKTGFACEFETMLTDGEILRACEADTLITGVFSCSFDSERHARHRHHARRSLMRWIKDKVRRDLDRG